MRDTELKRRRDNALYHTYVKSIERYSFSNLREAADFSRRQKAPEFFITPHEASLLVGKIQSTTSLIGLHPQLRARAWEIYARYAAYMKENPGNTMPRERILETIVEEEAPEYYVGVEMARKILLIERNKRKRKWLER